MDANNLQGIRYALQNKYGLRVVTHTQLMIVSTLINHPGLSAGKITKHLKDIPTQTIFASHKGLKEKGVIDKYNKLTFTGSDLVPKNEVSTVNYPIVSFVRERIIPTDSSISDWVHLAAYIATQPDPVGICEALSKNIELDTEQINILYTMQNGLALCSIMAGDVSQWADMKGEIQLSETVKLLLKKAKIK